MVNLLPNLNWILPVLAAVITVVVRNPIHSILWLIVTFLLTCGSLLHNLSLGFTCSLIIIVYIGAIAILFLFIVTMIPMQTRPQKETTVSSYIAQASTISLVYVSANIVLNEHLATGPLSQVGELWLSVGQQVGLHKMFSELPSKEIDGVTVSNFQFADLALYGARLYQEAAFSIMLTGLILFFVLLAAIVLCRDE